MREDNLSKGKKVAAILESLGTNLSAVVNMLIKQIILMESIPFEIKLSHPAYTVEEIVEETRATSALAGMVLTDDDIQMLTDYRSGKVSGDELRRQIYASITDEDRA
jgi:addiction module RelB/DinJ family antitoxin